MGNGDPNPIANIPDLWPIKSSQRLLEFIDDILKNISYIQRAIKRREQSLKNIIQDLNLDDSDDSDDSDYSDDFEDYSTEESVALELDDLKINMELVKYAHNLICALMKSVTPLKLRQPQPLRWVQFLPIIDNEIRYDKREDTITFVAHDWNNQQMEPNGFWAYNLVFDYISYEGWVFVLEPKKVSHLWSGIMLRPPKSMPYARVAYSTQKNVWVAT
jgi:hypothetical protein